MLIERQLENDFIAELKSMPELSASQVIGSREVAAAGETKSEEDTKATIVAVACGFRQNDAFSLTPITMSMSITVMTRAELDPTSEGHDTVIEAIGDLLSRWHKDGNAMSEALTSDKFLAGELRMDGGTARTYDSMNQTWSETISFSIRGAEKFPSPAPFFPDRQGVKMSDGTVIPMGDGFFSPTGYDINTTLRTLGYEVDDIAEIYVFSKFESATAYREYLKAAYVDSSCPSIGKDYWSQPFSGSNLEKVVFKGRTLEEVQAMQYYPWGLSDTSKIQVI